MISELLVWSRFDLWHPGYAYSCTVAVNGRVDGCSQLVGLCFRNVIKCLAAVSNLARLICLFHATDYVYFETSSTTPYQIRRVEELCKVGIACSKKLLQTFSIAANHIASHDSMIATSHKTSHMQKLR